MLRVRVSVKCRDCGDRWVQEFQQTDHGAAALSAYRHSCEELEGQFSLAI